MANPQIQYSGPSVSSDVPWETRRHLQLIYQKLGNHTQAVSLLNDKVSSSTGTTTTVYEGGNSGGGGSTVTGVAVNDQSGQTSYSTISGDNNTLIIFSDASPVAVSLTSQTPPWSCFIANRSALGGGTVTLTPPSPVTINGAASLAIPPSYCALVCFDGTNWDAATLPIVPMTFSAISHQFLTAYNAATGAFTAAQPAYSDISGTPQLANTVAPVAGEFLTGYDATTGNFSQATPTGLSVTIVTAALTTLGAQGSMQFLNGLLVAQTPAT